MLQNAHIDYNIILSCVFLSHLPVFFCCFFQKIKKYLAELAFNPEKNTTAYKVYVLNYFLGLFFQHQSQAIYCRKR